MSQPCPRCARDLPPERFACDFCADAAADDLHSVAGFAPHVDGKRARRGSASVSGAVSRNAEKPLPYDPRVSRVVDPIVNALTGWVRVALAENGTLAPPRGSLGGCAAWLADHVHWQSSRPWATEAFADYEAARHSLEELFEVPPVLVALGRCGVTDDEGVECVHLLAAEDGAAHATCPRCGAVHDVTRRRNDLLEQAQDLAVTVREAVRLLRLSGETLNEHTLRGVIRVVPVMPVGSMLSPAAARPVAAYRLGALREAVALMASDADLRRSVRASVKGGAA